MAENKNKRMTKKEFDQIKTMLSLDGVKTGMVKQWTGRSHSTIWHIKKSDSFEDYKRQVKESVANRPSNKKAPVWISGGTISETHPTNETIINKLGDIEHMLKEILDNQRKEQDIAKTIVDELLQDSGTSTPTKPPNVWYSNESEG